MNNLETLKQRRTELVEQVDAAQHEQASHLFEVTLENRKMMKTLMSHLDKGYTWKTQNAAVVVVLYDRIKEQYQQEVKDSNDGEVTLKLKGHELNGLYQALLNVEGTGVESARHFITMLTNVGECVTDAMSKLSEMSSEINRLHQELQSVENEIEEASREEVEAETVEE